VGIVACVVLQEKKENISGEIPTFLVQDKSEQERVCMLLAKILKAMIHDLENGIYLIVKH